MAKKEEKAKRAKVSQTEFPLESLAKALTVAEAILENYAGKGAVPHEIALAMDLSPTSSGWRTISGTSIAYGLTKGGCNAAQIELTELGKKIVASSEEGGDAEARVDAILKPRIMGEFFNKYDKNKLPKDIVIEHFLVSKGIPKNRIEKAIQLINENGIFTGILKEN